MNYSKKHLDILDSLKNSIKTKKVSLFLFGSYSYGDPKPESDLDIFIVCMRESLNELRKSDTSNRILAFNDSDIDDLIDGKIDILQDDLIIDGFDIEIYLSFFEALKPAFFGEEFKIMWNRFHKPLEKTGIPIYDFSTTNLSLCSYTQILRMSNGIIYEKSSPGFIRMSDGSIAIGTTGDKILLCKPIFDPLDIEHKLILPAWGVVVDSCKRMGIVNEENISELFVRKKRFNSSFKKLLANRFTQISEEIL